MQTLGIHIKATSDIVYTTGNIFKPDLDSCQTEVSSHWKPFLILVPLGHIILISSCPHPLYDVVKDEC